VQLISEGSNKLASVKQNLLSIGSPQLINLFRFLPVEEAALPPLLLVPLLLLLKRRKRRK
jgi:hypothetical protein